MGARIRILSSDADLAEAIGRRLRGWGLSVAVDGDWARVTPAAAAEHLDVLLLDVRRCEAGLLGWLHAFKQAAPALEVILLNLPGQVAISIAAMRAGASHELSAPFDLEALRSALSDALRRRHKRLGPPRLSLRERFERAMSAATFAQAGEHEKARQLLAGDAGPEERGSGERDRERRTHARHEEGS